MGVRRGVLENAASPLAWSSQVHTQPPLQSGWTLQAALLGLQHGTGLYSYTIMVTSDAHHHRPLQSPSPKDKEQILRQRGEIHHFRMGMAQVLCPGRCQSGSGPREIRLRLTMPSFRMPLPPAVCSCPSADQKDNNSQHLYSTYYVPSTVLSTFQMLSNMILPITL